MSMTKTVLSDEAEQMPIFKAMFQCVYPFKGYNKTAWVLGSFTRKECENYKILTAQFPILDIMYQIGYPGVAFAVSFESNLLISVVKRGFYCPIGRDPDDTVWKKNELQQFFSWNGDVKQEDFATRELYETCRKKFSPDALKEFDELVNHEMKTERE